jgi:hypothetical protein
MTNDAWPFSIEALCMGLGFDSLLVVAIVTVDKAVRRHDPRVFTQRAA